MLNLNYSSYQYKRCSPEETIQTIRNILYDVDILMIENQWFEVYGRNLSSVQVAIFNNFNVATSGKGINRKYALASGLAEFLERLQNLLFTRWITSCCGRELHDYPDTIRLKTKDINYIEYFAPKNSVVRENIHVFEEKDGVMNVVPFYNVSYDRLDYIPIELLNLRCGSNGMCAGNTSHEAIIQGICEIFEREILYRIYFENQSFPTIPDAFLKQHRIWLHINNFMEMGFEVEVKDCTLNGLFPVVGVIFSKDGRVNFCAGSAPDFNIALERCFTEIFQGKNLDTMDKYLYEKNQITKENFTLHYLGALESHSGALPSNLFVNQGVFKEENMFWSKDLTGLNPLRSLTERIKKMNLQLLVRDVSFLGFPSYFVYIPGLSERVQQKKQYHSKYPADLCSLKHTLFNLKKAEKEEMNFLANFIEEKYNNAKKNKDEFHLLQVLGIPYKENSSFNLIATEVFLAVLFCRIDNYDRALKILKTFLSIKPQKNDKAENALHCFIDIINILKTGKELKNINQLLVDKKYPTNVINENIFLLEPSTDIAEIFGIPKQSRDCSKCDVCYYKEFKELAQKIEPWMKNYHFDQMALRSVFS